MDGRVGGSTGDSADEGTREEARPNAGGEGSQSTHPSERGLSGYDIPGEGARLTF